MKRKNFTCRHTNWKSMRGSLRTRSLNPRCPAFGGLSTPWSRRPINRRSSSEVAIEAFSWVRLQLVGIFTNNRPFGWNGRIIRMTAVSVLWVLHRQLGTMAVEWNLPLEDPWAEGNLSGKRICSAIAQIFTTYFLIYCHVVIYSIAQYQAFELMKQKNFVFFVQIELIYIKWRIKWDNKFLSCVENNIS